MKVFRARFLNSVAVDGLGELLTIDHTKADLQFADGVLCITVKDADVSTLVPMANVPWMRGPKRKEEVPPVGQEASPARAARSETKKR